MNYDREPYVRLYRRKTPEFFKIGWEGRTSLWHLRIEADCLGRVPVEPGEGLDDIAARLDMSVDVFKAGLPKLFAEDSLRWEAKEGIETPADRCMACVLECKGGSFRIVDFVPSENAKRHRWIRVDEFNKKRRLTKAETLKLRRSKSVPKTPLVKIAAAQAAERGLLTRKQAADLWGISMATLRRRERIAIRTYLTDLGEHMFEEADVRAAAIKELPGAQTKPAPEREPCAEQAGDPIWAERVARLVEHMGERELTRAEMIAFGRKIGLKPSDTEETLIAREGIEIKKVDGKWSAVVAGKGDAK